MAAIDQQYLGAMLLAVGAEPILIGTDSTNGVVDELAADSLAGQMEGVVIQAHSKRVRIVTGSAPSLAIGSVLTIASLQFTAYHFHPIEDGSLTEIYCAKKP